MLPVIETLAGRFRWGRENKGLSQEALGRKLGVSQGAIEKVENGKTVKPKFLTEAAQLLDLPYSWLKTGVLAEDQVVRPSDSLVPVYGYAAGAGERTAINDGTIVRREARRYDSMGADGFYLMVIGDSMEPLFEQGDMVAVSTIMPPRKRKPCIIEFKDGTAIIKRFISQTGTEVVCEQLNPEETLKYPAKEVKAIYSVVGHEF